MIKRLRHFWKNRTNRRRFLLGSTLGSAGAMGASYGYMRLWESGWLEVSRHSVPISSTNKSVRPFRILHLSDLHASRAVSLGYLRRAIGVGLEQKPDLVCITGDFITWKYRRWDDYADVLRICSDAALTYACLGNHDGGAWMQGRALANDNANLVRQLLDKADIKLLHNQSATEQLGGRQWNIVGTGDLWNEECDADESFANVDTEHPTLVLSHNPDAKELLLRHAWQLMLSGHTHGGQIYLPGLGAPLAPVKDKKYVRGLHALDASAGRWLHITKGVGNLHGVRFNCRPEVSLLDVS